MSDFDDRFARLRARFATGAAREAVELERLVGTGAADWHGIRDLAHGLAGRAGMFGHGPLGDIARGVEAAIDEGEEPREAVDRLVTALRALGQGR